VRNIPPKFSNRPDHGTQVIAKDHAAMLGIRLRFPEAMAVPPLRPHLPNQTRRPNTSLQQGWLAASVLRLVGGLTATVDGLVDTSMEAYQQKEADDSLYTDRAKILALIDHFGGMTIWEAAKRLSRPDSDISSRFRDLEKARIIEKSHTVFKVNPRTKKRAHVWVRRRKEAA
jgi:hypothetical protein